MENLRTRAEIETEYTQLVIHYGHVKVLLAKHGSHASSMESKLLELLTEKASDDPSSNKNHEQVDQINKVE